MNFKSVDMQLAVHKNTDAAQFQKQLQDKPVNDQAVLASGQIKADIIKRRRSEGTNKTDKSTVDGAPEQDGKATALSEHKGASAASSEMVREAEHPYKGHRLDLSL